MKGARETLFGVLTGNLNTAGRAGVDREWSPKITAAYDKITFNEKLFRAHLGGHAARESAGLTPSRSGLLERTYEQYIRAGAKLSPDQKKRSATSTRSSPSRSRLRQQGARRREQLGRSSTSRKTSPALPESLRSNYQAAAKDKGLPGKWAVVNTRSSVDPFLGVILPARSAREGLEGVQEPG
jgi:peptidyl-dipeptidase Dcp